jgi:hypothetical protein
MIDDRATISETINTGSLVRLDLEKFKHAHRLTRGGYEL